MTIASKTGKAVIAKYVCDLCTAREARNKEDNGGLSR